MLVLTTPDLPERPHTYCVYAVCIYNLFVEMYLIVNELNKINGKVFIFFLVCFFSGSNIYILSNQVIREL